MIAPAPEFFVDLKEHFKESGVDVITLKKAISTYLDMDENTVMTEFSGDVLEDHQAFVFREILSDFLLAIS